MRSFWLFIFVLIAASCGQRATTAPTTRQLAVFASTFPLADLARQVGGVDVRVDWLIDLGDPLTGFVPTPRERERMITTELILLDGPRRTEGWAQQELLRMQATGRVASLEDLAVSHTMPSAGLLQLDPVAAKAFVAVLAEKFGELLPAKKAYFTDRARRFTAELDAVLRAHPNRVFGRGRVIVLDETLAPLLDRFSIGHVRVDADALRLSDRDAAVIRAKAQQDGAKVLLVPFDTPPGTITDIQARTSLRVVTIDPLGFPNFEGHSTYIEVLTYNLDQLKLATTD